MTSFRLFISLSVFCLSFIGCSSNLPPTPDASRTITGKVIRVTEGDLLQLRHHGQVTPIRLHGIDCPEKGQAYSEQARYRAECLVKDKEVSVVVTTYDLQGKTIGEVLLADGTSVNQQLVASGLCWWYRPYAPNDSKMAKLEAHARDKLFGLWAQPDAVPPWEYRRQQQLSR